MLSRKTVLALRWAGPECQRKKHHEVLRHQGALRGRSQVSCLLMSSPAWGAGGLAPEPHWPHFSTTHILQDSRRPAASLPTVPSEAKPKHSPPAANTQEPQQARLQGDGNQASAPPPRLQLPSQHILKTQNQSIGSIQRVAVSG